MKIGGIADALIRYRDARHWLIAELLRVQVQGELGSISMANARKERRQLQKEMLMLRHSIK